MPILALALSCVIGLSACNDDKDLDNNVLNTNNLEIDDGLAPSIVDTRDQRFLKSKTGDVIQVVIDDLIPTQGAIGYDQIYYKLGRWQGDENRPTWIADPVNQLIYLNKTVGKKFSDYCEAIGAKGRDDFATIQDLKKADIKQIETFGCQEQPGTEVADLKTVVVGFDGKLYLTDGHHTMTQFRELPDGGARLKVWVRVVDNKSDIKTEEDFWNTLTKTGRAWLKNGKNQSISYQQLPKNLGLLSPMNPTGMQNNPYRSLVYFTRDIGYSKVENATEYTEFLWEDWFHKQIQNNAVNALNFFHLDVKSYGSEGVLANSSLNPNLSISGSATSYQAAIAQYSVLMGTTQPHDLIYGTSTAASLGALKLEKNADKKSITSKSIENLAELNRDEIKKDKTPRTGGSVWYAVKYAECGKPQVGTCWGW